MLHRRLLPGPLIRRRLVGPRRKPAPLRIEFDVRDEMLVVLLAGLHIHRDDELTTEGRDRLLAAVERLHSLYWRFGP